MALAVTLTRKCPRGEFPPQGWNGSGSHRGEPAALKADPLPQVPHYGIIRAWAIVATAMAAQKAAT